MKRISQSVLGLTAFLAVPATVEEFQSFLTGDSTVLDYAIDEAYYRGVAPKVRTAYLAGIKEALGHEPKVLSEKTVGEGDAAKVVKTYEKDTVFIKRIRAEGATDAELTSLLQAAFDKVGWDLSSTRNTGPNKKDLEGADFYINAVAAGESTWERIVGKFNDANPGLNLEIGEDGKVSKDVMAEAVRVNRLRVEGERMI